MRVMGEIEAIDARLEFPTIPSLKIEGLSHSRVILSAPNMFLVVEFSF
jgi:hypothetical protein